MKTFSLGGVFFLHPFLDTHQCTHPRDLINIVNKFPVVALARYGGSSCRGTAFVLLLQYFFLARESKSPSNRSIRHDSPPAPRNFTRAFVASLCGALEPDRSIHSFAEAHGFFYESLGSDKHVWGREPRRAIFNARVVSYSRI